MEKSFPGGSRLGFSHVLAYDHILGANPERPGGWQGPYTFRTPFQEPLVLFSYMAAVTDKLGFASCVIILPQRQTAVFAKQCATLDVLSGGRLRVGVGLGWNEVEFTVLNENFHNRGKRIEEQVALLRLLWTQPLVQFEGRWHTIPDAGLNPLPVQRPIPIWFGGKDDRMLRRVAFLGDGWMIPSYRVLAEAQQTLDILDRYLAEAGRNRLDMGLEARIPYGDGSQDTWSSAFKAWQKMGVTHLSFNTMGAGLDTPAKHLDAIRTFAEVVGVGS